jgi:hypothetical protein
MTFTGCPCGCMTKLPYFDDPDCVRNRTGPEPFFHVELPPTPTFGDLIRVAQQILRDAEASQ